MNKPFTVYIYSDAKDFSFRAVVRNGIATFKGLSYLVALSSDGKRYYGRIHGPAVTPEYTTRFMAEWLVS